ncbi:ABC transporter ATP-binding protein [Desulforamulus hydrothermalis]|uniref:ABC transporter related protein n=1 Tax=Desulforamulus hydrothermalis Lam5 = DSM 18033 TaxID=1121428 RepID=K8DXH8_9FIRM|nr:ABC transporter ATP-binding protein [Desulforamulus hydrothermalis]CCO07289.1 ABC transporter related protein [Desulforamulus hydrothermalis Lam5 = DSM 18033]SHG93268.1 ABC-2 type transport system ATP-binding protein [Desulforamulus hydrothermalis Lam5 = DSM 18033]
MIKTESLCKRFGALTAVDRVSLHVEAGDIFGLVGPDGAGKTTLIRMICGLITPDSGSIDLRIPRQLASDKGFFGYMPQKFSLYGDLTVMENISFFGSMYGLSREVIRQRADQILQITNLINFKQSYADNLSGGMKQKLALTCALISRPALLVLDEPTFGVDPESRKEFWKILYRLNREGMTILVSTPYMDEAELCKKVGFMNNGKLAAVETPKQLKANYPYRILEVKATTREPEIFNHLEEVIDTNFYGDKYHVVVTDRTRAEEAILATLSRQGIQLLSLQEIPPSMEDVFVALAELEVM